MRPTAHTLAGSALAISALALAAVLGGVALSAPGDGGVIEGCYDESNGLLSVLTDKKTSCDVDTETPISWNVQGPPGATGPAGSAPSPEPPIDQSAEQRRLGRLSRSEGRRTLLPLAKGRRGARPVAVPVGAGGVRLLTANVGTDGQLLPPTGGPDTATEVRNSFYPLTYGDRNLYTQRILSVFFRVPVGNCTAFTSPTLRPHQDTGVTSGYAQVARVGGRPTPAEQDLFDLSREQAARRVVVVVRGASRTADPPLVADPFTLLLVCDPRNPAPRVTLVANPVPPGQ